MLYEGSWGLCDLPWLRYGVGKEMPITQCDMKSHGVDVIWYGIDKVQKGDINFEVQVTLQLLRSVSQYVKVSSPLWDLWPNITFCPKVVFWNLLSCLCGAPSLTRRRVCHLSFSV
jgi:hypothetical protein